jgi:hypothetical protein
MLVGRLVKEGSAGDALILGVAVFAQARLPPRRGSPQVVILGRSWPKGRVGIGEPTLSECPSPQLSC